MSTGPNSPGSTSGAWATSCSGTTAAPCTVATPSTPRAGASCTAPRSRASSGPPPEHRRDKPRGPGDGPPDPAPPAARRRAGPLRIPRQRRRDGFGPWTVVTKSDGRIIGWGGLYTDPFDPGWGPEVAYFFRRDAWGRGYASELVAASLDIADNLLELPEVSGFARPENAASRRVLEKAGFELVRFVPELDRWLYRRIRRAL